MENKSTEQELQQALRKTDVLRSFYDYQWERSEVVTKFYDYYWKSPIKIA